MLYDHPRYYELAFSFRDIAAETAVMRACIERFSKIPVRRMLELGCGPAPHAGCLAEAGYRLTGLDNNHAMLEYARERWRDLVPRPEFVHGDMVCFRLDKPVDFVFVMLGSLCAETSGELASHFDAVAKALRPGGLYLLDACIQFADPLAYQDNGYVIEQDGVRIDSSFEVTLLDAERHLYEEAWTVTVVDSGRTERFRTVERNRALLPEKFLEMMEEHSGFEFVGWWQDWDLARPLEVEMDAARPLALVRRVG